MDNKLAIYDEEFHAKAKELTEQLDAISKLKTPKSKVQKRPDGLDYVDEAFMRQMLDRYFPFWQWEGGGYQFLGSEWVVVSGTLHVYLSQGFKKSFYAPGAVRIQYKREGEHIPANIIDIDKNIASANTAAFKRAVNRLTHIADDVYKKLDPDIDEIAKEALLKEIALVKDDYKRSLWITNINNGKINFYNLEEFRDKLARELEAQQ